MAMGLCSYSSVRLQRANDSRKEAREAALRTCGLLPSTTNSKAAEPMTTSSPHSESISHSDSEGQAPELEHRPSSPAVSEAETLIGEGGLVNPTMHTDESIWRLCIEIEDPETRRATMVAYMG
ncbi:hypothetical protein V5O48_014638 [Marasmius crinis-equi]|uniref:Uncharacterized protein n=1 Tax=Marasmius crinis-equi TaxID=585013 RepID=A0ABR3EWR6_9AGAR